MTYVYPDFYYDFACAADKCRHSCCRGWEIDVDEESMQRYARLPGEWAEKLRRVIDREPTPHFRLTGEENCPFLRSDGLCDMILGLGEDSLCEICREHPRFYNEYPGRLEMGLGLCCEEAARLLLEGEGPLHLVEETEAGESPAPIPPVLRLREQVLSILQEGSGALPGRMASALRLTGHRMPEWSVRETVGLFRSLEQMDPGWDSLLAKLERVEGSLSCPDGAVWTRIAAYLIYRHFGAGDTPEECGLYLQFVCLSVALLAALEETEPGALQEHLRLFSGEIEYSDENIDTLLLYLAKKDA